MKHDSVLLVPVAAPRQRISDQVSGGPARLMLLSPSPKVPFVQSATPRPGGNVRGHSAFGHDLSARQEAGPDSQELPGTGNSLERMARVSRGLAPPSVR